MEGMRRDGRYLGRGVSKICFLLKAGGGDESMVVCPHTFVLPYLPSIS